MNNQYKGLSKAERLRLYELKKKSKGCAVGLSLLVSGLGHFYLGEWARGLICLITQIFLWFVLMGWIMWIITPIDAYQMAKKYDELLKIELGL